MASTRDKPRVLIAQRPDADENGLDAEEAESSRRVFLVLPGEKADDAYVATFGVRQPKGVRCTDLTDEMLAEMGREGPAQLAYLSELARLERCGILNSREFRPALARLLEAVYGAGFLKAASKANEDEWNGDDDDDDDADL